MTARRGPAPTTNAELSMALAYIAVATTLQRMVAETIRRYGRQGWDLEAIAPRIDEWFPEVSAEDKAVAAEIAAALALRELHPSPDNEATA